MLVKLLKEAGKPAIDVMAATVCGSALAKLDIEFVRCVLEFNEAPVELPERLWWACCRLCLELCGGG